MNLIACVLLPCLLQQVSGPAERPTGQEQPKPIVARAPAPKSERASQPDLSQLLADPEMHLTAISALEAEVAALRGTLAGLVSTGEMGVELLEEIDGPAEQLLDLGVSEERAEAVRLLSNDVRALRARLRLLDLRAPTDTKLLVKDSNQGFDPLEDQATAEAEALANRLAEERGSGVDSVRRQRSRYPSREALLAFKQGDYQRVVDTLSPFELHEIEPDALYVFGTALVRKRDFERARQVFLRVQSFGDRETLKQSAGRQLSRIAFLESGIVGPGAQLLERTRR